MWPSCCWWRGVRPGYRRWLRKLLRRVRVRTSAELAALGDCDIVVLLTAAADTVLRAEHLGAGCRGTRCHQPRNTSPDFQRQRPDVLLLDGGIVEVPGLRLHGGSMGLPDGLTFACLAETMLLSLSGHRGHFTLGRPTLEQIDHLRELADRHSDLGFIPASPRTFGAAVAAALAASCLGRGRPGLHRSADRYPHLHRRVDAGMTTAPRPGWCCSAAATPPCMPTGRWPVESAARPHHDGGVRRRQPQLSRVHRRGRGRPVTAGGDRTPLVEVLPRAEFLHGQVIRVDLAQRLVIAQPRPAASRVDYPSTS